MPLISVTFFFAMSAPCSYATLSPPFPSLVFWTAALSPEAFLIANVTTLWELTDLTNI